MPSGYATRFLSLGTCGNLQREGPVGSPERGFIKEVALKLSQKGRLEISST